jgi:hypothetical protein
LTHPLPRPPCPPHDHRRPVETAEPSRKGRSRAHASRQPEPHTAPTLGRPAIHAPAFPERIHNAHEANEEYGPVLDRVHTAQAEVCVRLEAMV